MCSTERMNKVIYRGYAWQGPSKTKGGLSIADQALQYTTALLFHAARKNVFVEMLWCQFNGDCAKKLINFPTVAYRPYWGHRW